MTGFRYLHLVLLVAVAGIHLQRVNGREGAPVSSSFFVPPTLATRGGSDSRPSQFLPTEYDVKGSSPAKFKVRQVPGDGGCLFHSLAVSIAFRRDKNHPECFDGKLREMSHRLRQLSIDVLSKAGQWLVMEGTERITSNELLDMVANNYNMTAKEYLSKMGDASTWGGGPEIVALSNHFKRPIHVYELDTCGVFVKQFQLKICAKFGSPEYDEKCPLYLLCADGRFPHLCPGTQKEVGDHFLAMFPSHVNAVRNSARGVRGGSSSSSSNGDEQTAQATAGLEREVEVEAGGNGHNRMQGVAHWLGSLPPLRGIAGVVGNIRHHAGGSGDNSGRGTTGRLRADGVSTYSDRDSSIFRSAVDDEVARAVVAAQSMFPNDAGDFDGLQ